MTALDTLTAVIALMAAAAGPESSEAAMQRDDDDWWHLCRAADRRAASRSVNAKTLRARRLLADDISYDRAYGEIMRTSAGRRRAHWPGHTAAAIATIRGSVAGSLPARSSVPINHCRALVRRRCGLAYCSMGKIP
jgi:hypothetical protein